MQRTTRFRGLSAALALAGALLAWSPPATAKVGVKVKTAFLNTGVQPEAEGEVEFAARDGSSKLEIEVEGLADGILYSLLFESTPWATFTVDDGEAKLRFESSPSSRSRNPMLPSDPRGGTLVVSDGANDVLTAVVSGPGEAAETRLKEEGHLDLGALAPGAEAATRFDLGRSGALFQVKAESLPAGDYLLLVDGAIEAAPRVEKDGGGFKVVFSNPLRRSGLLLDFEPRGSLLEIQGPTGAAAMSATAAIGGLNACAESEVEAPLQAVAGIGKAHSELKVKDDCDRDFEVEIEDVPEGAYDVYVDGVLRGTIVAAFDPSGGEVQGELEWDTDPDDPGELLLDFDPDGALVEVIQGATLFFSGLQTPAPPPAAGGGGAGAGCQELRLKDKLSNTGLLPGKGKAGFRIDDACETSFEVEIEDVPAGTYDLHVGGILRGQIVVGPLGEGEIEFETDPDDPGELPLDFDPRGQAVEVWQGGALVFERVFPG